MNDSSPEGGDRVIVSCPDCQEKYSIAVSRIPPQGGRLTCRICGGRIVLAGRRAGPGAPIVVKVPDPPASPGSGVRAARPRSAAPSSHPIECPHCGKSFTPEDPAKTAPAVAQSVALGDVAAAAAAESAPGPASDSPVTASSGFSSGTSLVGRKTILVAEDTEFFLELVKEILGAQYRMLGARTKTEALQLLGRERIDLVILDLSLEKPEDGLEILAGAAPRGLPCLIFTARNEADLWGEGWTRLQAKGATDLLLKGMHVEEQLLSKVAALLGTRN